MAILVDLVFVGIDHVHIRPSIDRQCILKERVRREHVIVIEKSDKIACRDRKSAVTRRRDMSVLLTKNEPYAWIVLGIFFEHRAYVRLLRCIIRNA